LDPEPISFAQCPYLPSSGVLRLVWAGGQSGFQTRTGPPLVRPKTFQKQIGRELRHGGRMALIADLDLPELPTGQAIIVAAHLENKCSPACRRKQMNALLADIKSNSNPVILAGDMNTTSKTNTPTSVRNEIMSRDHRLPVLDQAVCFLLLSAWRFQAHARSFAISTRLQRSQRVPFAHSLG